MSKKISLLLILLILVCGCESIQNKLESVKRSRNMTNITDYQVVEERCLCPMQIGAGMEKAVYLFSDIENNLNTFIESTDGELVCQFIILESEDIAETIYFKSKYNPVSILLDKASTMDFCDTGCIPDINSQYNFLYSKGLDIKVSDIHYNFCVNNQGVFITSELIDSEKGKNDYALFIKSSELSKKYKEEYAKNYLSAKND